MNKINAWSFSRLEFYKNCPYAAKLKYVDKKQELPRPPPVRGKEHANERGSRMHDNAEQFVLSQIDTIIHENKHFMNELEALRLMRENHPDRVIPEELWLFDKEWNPLPADAPYEDIWLRIIADMQVWNHDFTELQLIDYKSGKRDRNEVKHGKQLQLYQLTAFMRFPNLETVSAELWYLDLDLRHETSFSRDTGLKYFPIFNDQAIHMCNDIEFKAAPSEYRCRFCPYGGQDNKWVKKTQDCKVGV